MSDRDWFTIEKIDDASFIISELRHPEETHCYLLCGSEKALLIDTGLGICNIHDEVVKLTDLPITVVATHVHWDHIGGHKYFKEFYAHKAEQNWLEGEFPLPESAIQNMLMKNCDMPGSFDVKHYEIFQGTPNKLLEDDDVIELGGRTIKVLHTPGHSPGHLCFWEEKTGYLFTGDLIYQGLLYANYPSTDPKAYLKSVKKVANYKPARIFPGHNALDLKPDLINRINRTLQSIDKEKNCITVAENTALTIGRLFYNTEMVINSKRTDKLNLSVLLAGAQGLEP